MTFAIFKKKAKYFSASIVELHDIAFGLTGNRDNNGHYPDV
jgi:hypothetical protein